jgi:O-antigen/teichoic acid export membrane protein
MSSIKKILVNSGIYGISNILIKGINFLLLPLYTVYLTTQDYGILSVVNSYTYLFTIIFTFGLSRSTVRFYFIYVKNPEDVKKLWGTIITFIYTSALFFGVIFILFKSFLITPFIKDIDFFPYIFLGMMTVFLNPAFAVYQSTLPARHKALKYGIQNISRSTIRISITILLVVVIELGVVGVLLSQAITAFIFLIYTFFSFRNEITLGYNKKMLKETLRYSVPLVPISLANWFYTTIDIVFLNNLKSTASAGLYNIGFQIGGIILIVIDSIHSAFKPFFYESMEEGESGKIKIRNHAEAFVIFYAFAALSISFFGKEVLQLMVTKEFRGGWVVIPFISFSFVFSGIQYFFYYPVEYSLKGAKFLNIPTFLSAGINIALNYLLIPIFGIIGAAITTLISHIVSTSITLLISKRFVYIPYRWVKMYLVTTIFFVFSLINFLNMYIDASILFVTKILILGSILIYIFKSYKEEFIFLKNKIISKQ